MASDTRNAETQAGDKTMSHPMPKRINQAWIDTQNRKLQITVREIDGEVNPSYTSLLQEIEQAEASKQEWDKFAAWVKSAHNAQVNFYPIRTAAGRIDAGTVFYSKASNKFLTFESAWEKYCQANPEGSE